MLSYHPVSSPCRTDDVTAEPALLDLGLHHSATPSQQREVQGQTAGQLRERAAQLVADRNEYYQRAARAHRRATGAGGKGRLHGAVASYYAEQVIIDHLSAFI